jgi:choline dehydrogenase-like flavoprotein
MLTPRAAHVSVASQGNTLAQVFVEVDNQHDSQHGAHLQLYGYNDVMLAAGTRKLPVSPEAGERMLRPILGRMVIVQGYLHSSDSPGFTVRQDAGHLHVSGDDGVAGTMRVKKLVRRLARAGRLLGMFPVPGLVQIGLPGKGNHFGGSMPMRGRPGELETDTLGRLPGWSRVHVVDAAIFPSMPATTVTLSVMANAHRIASVAAAMLD